MEPTLTKIEIKHLLNFGAHATLSDIKFFNLLIGKNGVGKTGILRMLKEMKTDSRPIKVEPLRYQGENEDYGNVQLSTTRLDWLRYRNRYTENSVDKAGLTIEQYSTGVKHEIKFVEGTNELTLMGQGTIEQFQNRIHFIQLPISDSDYYRSFHKLFWLDSTTHKVDESFGLDILNFGLQYIFGEGFKIIENGAVIYRNNVGSNEWNYHDTLPSGVLQVIKLLTEIIRNNGKQILHIDEPENNLEPRACRRLIQFIMWLTLHVVRKESHNVISQDFEKWERLQWPKKDYKKNLFDHFHTCNIFISSHSPILIDEFLSKPRLCSVHEFRHELEEFNRTYWNQDRTTGTKLDSAYCTKIRRIDGNAHQILDEIGCHGSDILQANGVIWVEGPSDVIYIEKWLEMYATENQKQLFKKGKHFTFQMFGGALLDSICLVAENPKDSKSYKKIVEMFSFSRNAFVVVDSDCRFENGQQVDKSKFSGAKKFIRQQFENLERNGYSVGMWYKEGDTEIRTIENYLDDGSLAIMKSARKKIAAEARVNSWNSDMKLTNFKFNLAVEIQILYELIERWNK